MDVSKIVIAFSKDIMEIVRAVMSSDAGINRKVMRNTLTDSDIYREIDVIATHDGDLVFDFMLNNYLKYIESGRRAGAKMPPVKPIEDWARKHGIPTDNSTIFLIRRAISRDGIASRPIMDYVFIELDKMWDARWADEIFNVIMEEIDKFFN
jgi:hypothetical protein